MWRYNRLVRKGWVPIVADKHEINGIYWTNILLSKGMQRKTVRLDGSWDLSALKDKHTEKKQ